MGWMLALVVVVLVHQWLPQARWLMVHMVTLGLITTSIMVWGQHFAEALLKTRLGEESRSRRASRSRSERTSPRPACFPSARCSAR